LPATVRILWIKHGDNMAESGGIFVCNFHQREKISSRETGFNK
jgi:hypothetical protein